MERVAYTDGEKLCLLQDGQRTERTSVALETYRENGRRTAAADEWKYTGEGAVFRGDERRATMQDGFVGTLNGVTFVGEHTVAYTFATPHTSGIRLKNFSIGEKAPGGDEKHVFHSNTLHFFVPDYDREKKKLVVAASGREEVAKDIYLFDGEDYHSLTGGDSKDESPSFSVDGEILFSSAGVGRNGQGEFVTYAPSAIYSMNPLTLDMVPLKEDKEHSYTCPRAGADGALYAIRRPIGEEEKRNIFLEIILIPVRLLQAFAGLIQVFVTAFTGKSLTGRGVNPTKGREYDGRNIVIEGNRINAEKELKKNARFKENDYGFIPRSWQLVRLGRDGSEQVLRSGVAEFALGKEGIYYTDGRHVYRTDFAGENREKLADCESCLHLAVYPSEE